MRTLLSFNDYIKESLEYSGGDVTKMPVIGTIVTEEIPMTMGNKPYTLPSTTEDVVEIIETERGKYYVLNKWHKPGVPRLEHESTVKSYTPKHK